MRTGIELTLYKILFYISWCLHTNRTSFTFQLRIQLLEMFVVSLRILLHKKNYYNQIQNMEHLNNLELSRSSLNIFVDISIQILIADKHSLGYINQSQKKNFYLSTIKTTLQFIWIYTTILIVFSNHLKQNKEHQVQQVNCSMNSSIYNDFCQQFEFKQSISVPFIKTQQLQQQKQKQNKRSSPLQPFLIQKNRLFKTNSAWRCQAQSFCNF